MKNSASGHARAVRVRTLPSELKRQREFGGVVAVRRVDEEDEIAVAGGQINLLDLDADLLGPVRERLARAWRILDPRLLGRSN